MTVLPKEIYSEHEAIQESFKKRRVALFISTVSTIYREQFVS